MAAVYVGTDVAKAHLDRALSPATAEPWRDTNDLRGIRRVVARLQPLPVTLIVLEATGGYETAVATALALAGLPVAVVNPRQVRDCAKALGYLAKTDQLDAAVLAECAAPGAAPPPRALPTEAEADLRARVARRAQLVEMRTAEQHRLGTARPGLRTNLRTHIRWLTKQIASTDRRLRTRIEASPVWRVHDQLLQSVPGVGPTTASRLLAHVPELGHLTHRELAALIGVAPLNRDSGARSGPRTTWGGRAPVRAALYMATVVACQHNPVIRTFYQRLCTAAMHKLLTILNAMMKHQTPWIAPA